MLVNAVYIIDCLHMCILYVLDLLQNYTEYMELTWLYNSQI
jgi:hypothetical protein